MGNKIKEMEAKVVTLCKEITPYLVIVYAAKYLGWGVAIEKTKNKTDAVEGMVVGTDRFIDKHTPLEQ